MYKGKKIVGIVGKIGSGKSYLLNVLKTNTASLCIDCDKVVESLMPLSDRKKILNEQGLECLQRILYPVLIADVLETIEDSIVDLVFIEGVKVDEAFFDVLDVVIVCSADTETRRKRVLDRGDSLEKFEYFNRVQELL